MYTLFKKLDGTLVLQRDKKNLRCPYFAPIMQMPKYQGQPTEIIYTFCNSECALFKMEQVQSCYSVTQNCGSSLPYTDLKIEEEKTVPTLNISK